MTDQNIIVARFNGTTEAAAIFRAAPLYPSDGISPSGEEGNE